MSDWLSDTRLSYDTVASSYADLMRGALAGKPLLRGVLAMFAEAVLAGGGPVADLGCGPGHLTAYLHDKGLDAFGIDLSPAMIEIARRDHPGLRFEVGSMTGLALPDRSAGGVVAFFSLIHLPDEEVPVALAQFHRVLRPGGVVLLGFHVGDEHRLKTEGYGGHPMKVWVHWRPVDRMAAWIRDTGLVVDAQVVLEPDAQVPAGILVAHRP
ncbi:class I SAM-dependent methyltransferase [Amycolatopsis rhizosphaerae]|nr:class I SAM-dependent methyltransferase [Amycolatopsis rhizosphaerae]